VYFGSVLASVTTAANDKLTLTVPANSNIQNVFLKHKTLGFQISINYFQFEYI